MDWYVLQFDEEGMTGVYGGVVVKGSGIDHVKAKNNRKRSKHYF